MSVRLKPQARADLLAIRTWGEQHWGPARTRDFLEGLIETIERLQENPLMGRGRAAFGANLRSVRYQGYVLFYLIETGMPVIIAVLHERRNHAALNFADRMEEG
jgi:toxin ParE1/3/4